MHAKTSKIARCLTISHRPVELAQDANMYVFHGKDGFPVLGKSAQNLAMIFDLATMWELKC